MGAVRSTIIVTETGISDELLTDETLERFKQRLLESLPIDPADQTISIKVERIEAP